MKVKIIPTIFALNKKEFFERFEKLKNLSKELQIDFMDGKFVKSKSVNFNFIPSLKKYPIKFEAHLMTIFPEKYFKKLKQKGFSKIIFHIESKNTDSEVKKTISQAKKLKVKTYIALNPETKLQKIYPFLRLIDGVLLMGVHPGKEHQKLISSVYKKIKLLKTLDKNIAIQIDGGVSEKNAKKLFFAGANILNSGSFIYSARDPQLAINQLKN